MFMISKAVSPISEYESCETKLDSKPEGHKLTENGKIERMKTDCSDKDEGVLANRKENENEINDYDTASEGQFIQPRGESWLSISLENCKNPEDFSQLLAFLSQKNGREDEGTLEESSNRYSENGYGKVLEGMKDIIFDLDYVSIKEQNGVGVVSHLLCLHAVSTETWEQIERDIPRTYPDIEYFFNTDIQDSILRILRAIATEFPSVGYVQGMNFIAAQLLFHCDSDEDQAFLVFRRLIMTPKYDLKNVFVKGLPKVMRFCTALDVLIGIHNPAVHAHLNKLGLESVLYAQQWIMTLFSYNTNFNILAGIWDYFFLIGWQSIFKIGLCILDELEQKIVVSNFEECSDLIRDYVQHMPEDICVRAKNMELDAKEIEVIDVAIGYN